MCSHKMTIDMRTNMWIDMCTPPQAAASQGHSPRRRLTHERIHMYALAHARTHAAVCAQAHYGGTHARTIARWQDRTTARTHARTPDGKTKRTHARTHACTHARTHCSAAPCSRTLEARPASCVRACARARARVRVSVRVSERACVHAYVRARVRACVRAITIAIHDSRI